MKGNPTNPDRGEFLAVGLGAQRVLAGTVLAMLRLGQCSAQAAFVQAQAVQAIWLGLLSDGGPDRAATPMKDGTAGQSTTAREQVAEALRAVRAANDDWITGAFDLVEQAADASRTLTATMAAVPAIGVAGALDGAVGAAAGKESRAGGGKAAAQATNAEPSPRSARA